MDAHHLDVPACAELAIAYPVQHDCPVFRGPSAGTNDRPLAVLGTVCDFRPWRLSGTYGVGCGGSGRHRLANAAYGASGALFGLFASLLVVYRRIGADIRSMLIWMAVNFALPFVVGGVAWQAHVGGFVVGGILTWLLVGGVPAWRGKSLKWRMQVYGWAMVVLVIALILLCNMANPYGWMSFGSLH